MIAPDTTTDARTHAARRAALVTDADADAVARRLRDRGVAIATTSDDLLDDRPSDLVIGFGLAPQDELVTALDLMRDVLSTA